MSKQAMKYILAVDLGTGGPKVALCTTDGEILGSEFVETPVELLPGGGAEQSPDMWWNAIMTGMRGVLGQALAPIDDIVAISCTAQWSGTVAVDRQGEALMNAVIWMDSRGGPQVSELVDGPIKVGGYAVQKLLPWLRLSGGIPAQSGKDPIAHILYIKHNHPDVYDATYKFLEPLDYLNMRFTGKFAASYSSIALHWVTNNRNVDAIRYDDRLLRLAHLDRNKLPALRPVNSVLGTLEPELAKELGLLESVKVVMGAPDLHAAAIGSGAVRDFDGHIYIGTSSWITCHVPFMKVDPIRNMASLASAIPGRYFVANEQETSGECLDFLRNNVFFPDDELGGKAPENVYALFDRMAERVPPGSDRLLFMPWLFGERTPVEDRLLRGGFVNMSLNTTRAHIIRAVLEGVGYNLRWLCGAVEHFIGARFRWLNIIGGGGRSAIWCQILADILDREIRQVEDPFLANVRGAAFIGAVALGYLSFSEIPSRVNIAHHYRPNPANRALYDQLFREFLRLYKNNRRTFARLNAGDDS